MTSGWIVLSTRWSLSSVQAALNVIISVLATVGVWSFSRYWWQRGSSKILREKRDIPLSALFTFTGPGEVWDLVAVLRKQVLARENWHLLVQLVVVASITLACMLSGPIAKVSLRSGHTIRPREIQVLQTTKGGGYFGNLIYANVLWNNTIQSLDRAGFPTNQLLDYLPASTEPWTYAVNEWDPTWTMDCNNTPETVIKNLTGSGNYSVHLDPLRAFPAYRDTFDPSWFNTSKYRIDNNFGSWEDWDAADPIRHLLIFLLIQSDPEVDNRMYTNNETLQISISVLHAQDFQAIHSDIASSGGAWMPIGPVANASYARTECNITRKAEVADEDMIPWVWTNDTYSITEGYMDYWEYLLEDRAGRNLPVPMPSADDLFRFYQAYMATTNTNHSFSSRRTVSIWLQTVELSVIFLVIVIILFILTFWNAGRYFIFMWRHKSKIDEMYVPDGKMGWMIHAAKSSAIGLEEQLIGVKQPKDRDHFRTAAFGLANLESNASDAVNAELRHPSLARVYNSRGSTSGASITAQKSVSKAESTRLPALDEYNIGRNAREPKDPSRSVRSNSTPSIVVSPTGDSPLISPLDPGANLKDKMLDPEILKRSLSIQNRSLHDENQLAPERKRQSSDAINQSDSLDIEKLS